MFLCRSKFTLENYPYVTLEFAAVQVNTATRMYITCVIICARDVGFCLIVKNVVNAHLDFGFHRSLLNLKHE